LDRTGKKNKDPNKTKEGKKKDGKFREGWEILRKVMWKTRIH